MPPPTLEQDAWIASTFGIDPANYPPAANSGMTDVTPNGAPYSAPATSLLADAEPSAKPSSPTPGPAPAPAPTAASAQDTTPSCWITVTNDTKSVLKLARQGHDIGDFESFPAPTLEPGSSTSFVSTQTPNPKSGQQGSKGYVEWTIGPADRKGDVAATWRVAWNNPLGEKNTVDATITPANSGFKSLEQIGQGDVHVPVVFTLSTGASAVAQPATRAPHDVEITIQNATDGTLLLAQEVLSQVSTQSLIPVAIAPGQTAQLVVEVPYMTSSALVYAVVPTGVTKAPGDAPTWEVQWLVDPADKLVAQPNDPGTPGLTAEAHSDGIGKATFKLSGKLPAAAPAQRVGISISNDTDQIMHLVSTNSDGGRFDPVPPGEIAPGAKVALAAVGTGPKGGTLVYRVEPKDGVIDKPEQLLSWTLSWTQQAGQQPLADATLDPEMKGWLSAASAGKSGVAYVLAGTTPATAPAPAATTPAPAPVQPQAPVPVQNTRVTLINKSNMLLRLVAADRTKAQWDPLPPNEIKPGDSFALTTVTKAETDADLWYAMLTTDGSAPKDADAPDWVVRWRATPGELPMAWSDFTSVMPGLVGDAWIGQDEVTFQLSGDWSAQPREFKTNLSISNETRFTFRLTASQASAARFDPAPPKELAPGAKLAFATWAKEASNQKLVYEAVSAEHPPKGTAKPPTWTVTWHTQPGYSPTGDTSVDDMSEFADVVISGASLQGHDGMAFYIHADDPDTK
jgi:hypothetical protein